MLAPSWQAGIGEDHQCLAQELVLIRLPRSEEGFHYHHYHVLVPDLRVLKQQKVSSLYMNGAPKFLHFLLELLHLTQQQN